MGVILLSRNKKTDEKSRGRHAMPEENNKKNNDKQIKQKQQNMRIKKQEPVKAKSCGNNFIISNNISWNTFRI